MGFILYYIKFILATPYIILAISLFFFGVSIAVDAVMKYHEFKGGLFMEDGSKFVGIVSWFAYFVYVSFSAITGKSSGN
jgi:hypothetical protein